MDNTYFDLIDASGGSATCSATYVALPSTGGPWSPQLQHGGPPNALLVHTAEQLAGRETGRTDLHALRLAAEFLRPVPVGVITVTARIVRAARTVVLVDATITADGQDCLHGRVWLVRDADTAAIAAPIASVTTPPGQLPGVGADFPYGQSIEWRSVHGGLQEPGPALVWARPRLSLLHGTPMSGLQRAALIGDSASGLSAELDWGVWSFLNVDLDIHLARPAIGDWLLVDAQTTLTGSGTALARSTLTDLAGPGALLGTTAQTLVVEPRRR